MVEIVKTSIILKKRSTFMFIKALSVFKRKKTNPISDSELGHNSGSRTGKKFPILADPGPKH
jgi:hypothetical protein